MHACLYTHLAMLLLRGRRSHSLFPISPITLCLYFTWLALPVGRAVLLTSDHGYRLSRGLCVRVSLGQYLPHRIVGL